MKKITKCMIGLYLLSLLVFAGYVICTQYLPQVDEILLFFMCMWMVMILIYAIPLYITVLVTRNLKYGFITGLLMLALMQMIILWICIEDMSTPGAWSGLAAFIFGVCGEPVIVILFIITIVFLIRIRKGKTENILE